MEMLKLSKFKLQLRALIAEVHELKVRERSAAEQLNFQIQKQKQSEEEYGWRIQQLEAEVASVVENKQKLERKVEYLQNDNAMLENKQKELKGTISNLLQSRECFVNVYEESTSEMKRSIEARDRKIAVLSEKINSHLLLFDSIEKEAFGVKQVVDRVQQTVAEKEHLVAELKSKMEKVSSLESLLNERISVVEITLKDQGKELQTKNKAISELEAQLEVAKMRDASNSQIEELLRTVSAKDMIIENLVYEKKALQLEVGNLSTIFQKIQDAFVTMNEQDKGTFSSIFESQEGCATNRPVEIERVLKILVNIKENTLRTSSIKEALLIIQEQESLSSPLKKYKSCCKVVSESACSVSPLPTGSPFITTDSDKVNVKPQGGHFDSECSTTQYTS